MGLERGTGVRTSGPGLILAIGCLASVLLALPALRSPLFADDAVHRAMLTGRVPSGLHWGPLQLYEFVGGAGHAARALRDRGILPWFTADELRLRFFRPLSSATLAVDERLFGPSTWPGRLHSLLWFLGLLCAVSAIHRRCLSSTSAGVATLVFALAGAHAVPISWMAARHVLVARVCGVLAFWLHLRHRQDGRRAARWLSLAALVAGLGAGEMALGALALVAAYEWLGRRESLTRRAAAVAPAASIAALYVGAYVATGYGAHGSGGYIGLESGSAGAVVVARHFWILAGELVTGFPSDALTLASTTVQTLAAAGSAVCVLAAMGLLTACRRHVAESDRAAGAWMAVASALAVVPGSFGMLGGRVLALALAPASGVVAIVLVAGWRAVRTRGLAPLARASVMVMVGALGLMHLVAAPVVRVAVPFTLTRVAREQRRVAATAPTCTGVMIVVAADDPTIAMFVPAALSLQRSPPQRLHILSMAAGAHRIEGVTSRGFDLLVTDGRANGRTVWERLFRAAPVPPGVRATTADFEVTVIEADAGAPVRTRFVFTEPLDSRRLCFVQWRAGQLARLTVPAPGERLDLPWERGPMSR
jgi:hypothetical protein